MDFLGTLAENKEWGAILLLLGILLVYMQAMFKNNNRLVSAFIAFSGEIPKLAKSIETLQVWLEGRFTSVDKDLDDIKDTQKETSERVDDHEKRIGVLEDKTEEPFIPIPINLDDKQTKKRPGKKRA